jgi:FAD/FMN-containing dehydrogenase
MARLSPLIHLIFYFSTVTLAAVTPATTSACKALQDALPNVVFYETGATAKNYKLEQANYWSVAIQEEKPTCIVQPTDAEMVSKAVKILNQHKDVKFAVKSGGHDPNPGHSAAKDGIVIALSHLNGTTYDKVKKVAYMKPGGTWATAIAALGKDNVTVVGGRLGVVGIGGYLAQGGVSFLSAQYGLAADVGGTTHDINLYG